MIAIMKIDSVDVINLIDSEKADLRFIPSNRINLNKSELSFYKILFTQDVTAREEPDPDEYIHKSDLPSYYWNYIKKCIAEDNFPTEEELNPENYLLKSKMPLYYWNFSKYALSKPANIEPSNYNNLCNLLQAKPQLMNNNKVFNWTTSPNNYFWLGYNQSASITADSYYFKNGQQIITLNKINPRTDTFSIKAIVKFSAKAAQTIVNFYNPSNSVDVNNYWTFERTANSIRLRTHASSLSGSLNVTLNSKHDMVNHPATLSLNSKPNTDNTVGITIRARYTYDDIYVTTDWDYTDIPFNRFPTNLLERINSFVYRNSGATVNSTTSGAKEFYEYEFHNETTGDKTIIKFDDSKIINDKLLIIA